MRWQERLSPREIELNDTDLDRNAARSCKCRMSILLQLELHSLLNILRIAYID